MEEWPPIWRAAANILNLQSPIGSPLAWELGGVLITPHHKKCPCYKTDTNTSSN